MDDSEEGSTDLYENHEDRMKKWVPMLVLGSIGPAIFGIVIIFVGSIIVTFVAKYPDYECTAQRLDIFLAGAIAISMIYLLVFCWIFLGFHVSIKIKNRSWTILKPFTSILYLGIIYLILLLTSLVWWSIGSFMVAASASACSITTPALYSFCSFIMIFYWIGLFLGIVNLIKTIFSKHIVEKIKAGQKMISPALNDDDFLQAKFAEYDEGDSGKIERDHLGPLLKDCGRKLTPEELEEAREILDPDQSGYIEFGPFLSWFREGKVEDLEEKDDDSEESYEESRKRR
mmetsp:Transcript_1771/g.2405  ORF Transcript_1771/g.2405 Transcript_1771/m.2405 type:complete len:287 (-) Transcript_1771:102-962(-)